MDRALKERLVGAVVLVALGVWLIPLFLDGGPEDAAKAPSQGRALTLPLPNEAATPKPGVRTKTIEVSQKASNTQSKEPVVIAKATDKPVKEKSAPPAAPVRQKPVSAPPINEDGWFVQLGSFGSQDNAKRLAKEVDALGWDARVSPFVTGGKTLHRVRVGPSPTRSKAESVAKQLAQRGFDGQVRQADS